MAALTDQDLEDQANALTSCSICMDPFDNPKVLPCQHTFCLACIESHYSACNKQRLVAVSNFPCPTCRAVCYVPLQGLKSLPADFKVEQIRELMKTMKEVSFRGTVQNIAGSPQSASKNELGKRNSQPSDGAVCAVCRVMGNEKLASNFCLQCSKHFCSQCSTNHCKNSLFSDHSVLPISPASTDPGGWKCEEHQSEMTYYCDGCSIPACMLCVTCDHEGHNVIGRTDALSSVHKKAKDCAELMDRKTKEYDAKIEAIKRLKQEQSKAFRETEKAIKKAVKELELQLKELEKQKLVELKRDYDDKVQAMSVQEKTFQERQKVAKGLSGQLNDLSSNNNMKFTLTSYSGLEEKANTELISTCDITPSLFEHLIFKQDLHVSIGDIETSVLASEQRKAQFAFQKDANKNSTSGGKTSGIKFKGLKGSFRRSSKQPSASASIAAPIPETSSGRSTPAVPGTPISPRASFNGDSSAESGRTSTLRRAALVEQLERRLSSTRTTTTPSPGTTLDTLGGRFNLSQPPAARHIQPASPALSRRASGGQTFMGRSLWRKDGFTSCRDCCFTVDGQIAAVDYGKFSKERVKIFSSDGTQLHSIDSILISEPWAICYNSETSSILITDHGGSSVSIKSVKIASLRDVSSLKCGSTIDRPSGIAFLRSGDLVLTETSKRKNKVVIYSKPTSGRLSRSREFGPKGDGEGEVLQANYVAVDNEDNIIISDCESHHIKIFSKTGQPLLKFSACVSDGKDMIPQGVAVDQYNNIFVSDQAAKGVLKFGSDSIQIGDLLKTQGVPWGLSYCRDRNRLAVAVDNGIEVFQL